MVSLRERIATHEAGHACAAIVFGMPLVRASIIDCTVDCSGFRAPRTLASEFLVTFWLSGGEAEQAFFGVGEGSAGDLHTAGEYLVQKVGPLRLGVELDRYRSAARSLVTAPSTERRIRLIADAAALWKFAGRTDLRTRGRWLGLI
jgi:hypothetical protein